jgi:nucleoside-diphosphate-sugar epimerase
MSRVLVIGGSGFSGQCLLKELVKGDHEVFAIRNNSPIAGSSEINLIPGGISAVGRQLIDELKPEVIFHFARPKFPRLRKAGRILAAHLAAFHNRQLIKELERSKHTARLVFASGSLMYGSSSFPFDEDAPLNPVSFARQYYRGEAPILQAIKEGRVPVMVLRLPWLLGKGSWFEWFYLKPMISARAVPLFGRGDNFMEVIDMKDAAALIIRYAFENEKPGIFNLLTAGAVTQSEFAETVSGVSELPVSDYCEVFSGRLEKEVLQAFSSDIRLTTRYPDLIKDRYYTPLAESLSGILHEAGLL